MGIHEEIARALRWQGPSEGVKMCALMHVLHAIVRGTNESRDMVVVLRMLLSLSLSLPLSLSHTRAHTSKLEDRSLMYTQCIGICLCLIHA